MIVHYKYCRDGRPSRIYWAKGSVRGRVNVSKRSALINKGRDLSMMVQEGDPRRDASLDKQGRVQKVRPVIQSNILGVFINKDARHGGMGAMKYLRESYYHRIECSVANSLTAIIRK